MVTSTAGESMADVVKVLCDRIAEANAQLAHERTQHGYTEGRYQTASNEKIKTGHQLERVRKELSETYRELQTFKDAEPQRLANLRLLDRITLDLFHLIVELSGHRDTGKTKAERVALGHVVERLKTIRGWTDDDAASAPGAEQ